MKTLLGDFGRESIMRWKLKCLFHMSIIKHLWNHPPKRKCLKN